MSYGLGDVFFMDRIISSYLSEFIGSHEIEETDISKQFEAFVAYSTISQRYDEDFELNDVMTGAGGDCGIDAIAVICNGALINSTDEVDDIIKMNKSISEVEFIFVQAKNSGSFSGSEIGTFGAGIKDFFSDNHGMVQNQAIIDKKKLIEYIYSNASKLRSNPKCVLYYVTTGKWVNDSNCLARITLAKEDLENENIFSKIDFIPVDSALLQKYYRKTIDDIETTIKFEKHVLLPDIPNVTQAFIGYLSYPEFYKLIYDEDTQDIRKSVFYDNIRDYQGVNSVNAEMADTVKNNPRDFLLYNNGVTIICNSIKNTRDEYTLSAYQIVNGCQTSHVLFGNSSPHNTSLFIPVKLIETQDESTINNIIKATNRQTEVTDDQLMTLGEFHKNLEAFYNSFDGNKRLYYERRSKQYAYSADVEKVRIVSVNTQIKSVAAMFFDRPHMAARYYGQLLKSVNGLFDKNDKLIPYYTSAYVLYKLEFLFRNKMLDSQYRKYRFHLMMLLKYDTAERVNKVPRMNENKMDQFCDKILQYAYDNDLFVNKIKDLCSIIDSNVDDINNQEMTKSGTLVDNLKKLYQ